LFFLKLWYKNNIQKRRHVSVPFQGALLNKWSVGQSW
jgi:hypothetical protein